MDRGFEVSVSTTTVSGVNLWPNITLTQVFWLSFQPQLSGKAIEVELEVDGKLLQMEIDTGATVSIILEEIQKRLFPGVTPQEAAVLSLSLSTLPSKNVCLTSYLIWASQVRGYNNHPLLANSN